MRHLGRETRKNRNCAVKETRERVPLSGANLALQGHDRGRNVLAGLVRQQHVIATGEVCILDLVLVARTYCRASGMQTDYANTLLSGLQTATG